MLGVDKRRPYTELSFQHKFVGALLADARIVAVLPFSFTAALSGRLSVRSN